MPKIFIKINHLKAKPSVMGYVRYVATREGVDKSINRKVWAGKPTEKQIAYIEKMLKLCPNAINSYEYADYMENPTRQNASAFITMIAEEHPELSIDRETYVSYIATRPRAERMGEHGLFGAEDRVDMRQIKQEILENKGVVWIPIISLKREDAARLGYDNAASWRDLIRAKQMELAELFGIPYQDFRWYGAFHDEGHHPHLQMVVYSAGSRRGFLREKDIEKMKSLLANEIFKDEMYALYDEKTQARERVAEEVKEQLQTIVQRIQNKDFMDAGVCPLLLQLAETLHTVKGKKLYGYLPKPVKRQVDEIVRLLAQDEDIQKLYAVWCSVQNQIVGIYQDKDVEYPPLWENREFKKIRNAVVKEAVRLEDERDFFALEGERETGTGEEKERNAAFMPQAEGANAQHPKYQMKKNMGIAAGSAFNLFCRLANIIQDDANKTIDGHNKTIVDSRQRREIQKKKQRLGYRLG